MISSHLRILIYDLRCMWSDNYDQDNDNMEHIRTIIDNEAAISIENVTKIQQETDM